MSRAKVEDHMSKHPYRIHSCVSAKQAYLIMQNNGFRHLPVIEGHELIGVISERDLKQVMASNAAETTTVWPLMSRNPYVVREGEPVENVVRKMRQEKYGCVVIMDQSNWITGIFTAIDALELLEKMLHEKDPESRKSFGAIEKYLSLNSRRPFEATA